MSSVRIKVENLSKQYRLGEIGTGTLSHDINRLWHRARGKEDPYSLVTEENDRTQNNNGKYVWALQDINFDVMDGEILGIIGKNGAGKSTLLKILSKVTGPTSGTIKLNGRVASLLEVGTGMHPELTGRENIFLNGAILGMNKAEIRLKFDAIVDFAGIAKYVDTPIKRYSSGMRVRLGFAVAAFLEPEILIVDEVLAVGDAEFQKKAIGKLHDVSQNSGRTVLFVSHNMGAIRSLCTRSILLEKGKIAMVGDSDECVNQYLINNSEGATIDLKSNPNRSGNGKLIFSAFSLVNDRNETVTEVISGEYVKIKIEFEQHEPVDFSKLIFAINFRDQFENTVISLVTDEMGINLTDSNTYKAFQVEIPKLMLRGGQYNIRLLAMEGTTHKDNFIDEVNNAFKISVIGSDHWNVGKVIRSREEAFSQGKISLV